MPSITELREARNKAMDGVRQLRDKFVANGNVWQDEERSAWEKANAAYDEADAALRAATEANDVERRMADLEAESRRSVDEGRQIPGQEDREGRRTRENRGRSGERNIEGGEDRGALDLAEDRQTAINAWFRHKAGGMVSRSDREACRRAGISLGAGELRSNLSSGAELEQIQERFLSRHPSLHQRALGTGGTGAELVPVGFIRRLEEALLAYGPMWQTSTIIRTDSGNDLHHPTANDTGNEGAIIGENAQVDGTTADPTFDELVFGAFKFSSRMVKVSSEMLEDSAFDLAVYLARAFGERLGRGTNRKFTVGAGTTEPTGIVTASTLGVTAASATAITADELIKLAHSVDPAYRVGGRVGYMMHDSVIMAARLLKESTTNAYIWQPGLQLGQPDVINGFRVYTNQHMAGTLATTNKVALFGDLSKYVIRAVKGVRHRRLTERYADYDQEGFISYLRADGNLLDAGTHPVKHLALA